MSEKETEEMAATVQETEKTSPAVEDKDLKPSPPASCDTSAYKTYSTYSQYPTYYRDETINPPSAVIHESVPHLPNFFGRIRERNVTFCLDTSGSMYRSLGAVKEQLIEFLNSLASHPLPTTFNLVEFSTDVRQWADKMVACTQHTVKVASEWINGLEAKTGTNTLDALMVAMGDERCDAVVLVTDGMPDQNPCDILDHIGVVCGDRPVHCYYIRNGVEHEESSEVFLRDLAMETYGSFHVVTVTQHGAIERITPVYRAEAAAEQIIRTTEGTIYPSNMKTCTVGTSLSDPVEYVVEKVGPDYIVESHGGEALLPCYDTVNTRVGNRFYYSYYYPYLGWSRFRQNDRWKKSADQIIDLANGWKDLPPHITPGPGSLVVGSRVLARRHSDGYFYRGTIKSEIVERKFLVEFEACKYGKYRETAYQETYLYDLISLDDALRHSVLVGDKVLAPVDKNHAECYAPGTVIEGQERRSSDIDAGSDSSLVVALDYDGKSTRLSADRAVWIPRPLHERIVFELSLPAKVRQEVATSEDYPMHSLPGYPCSGVVPFPEEYDRFEEVTVHRANNPDLELKGVYRAPYFVPLYPVHYKNKKVISSAVKGEDFEEVIPGTGFTKDQLNDKVLAQLLEHKKMLEEIKKDQKTLREKISTETSEKHVTFTETALNKTETETTSKDSGHESVGDILSDLDIDLSDLELDDLEVKDAAAGTIPPGPILKRRRRIRRGHQQPWKYWKSSPTPSLLESNHYGKYRVGPFRECLMEAPPQARADKFGEGESEQVGALRPPQVRFSVDVSRQGAYRPVPSITDLTPSVLQRIENDTRLYNTEWTSPMSKYVTWGPTQSVDGPRACHSLGYIPHPPSESKSVTVEKQTPGVDISVSLAAKDTGLQKEAKRRDAKRQRIIERERTWETRRVEKEQGKSDMLEQNRQRVLNQVRADWQRCKDEQDRVAATRDAKRAITAELRTRVEDKRAEQYAREEARINALRERRERLEGAKRDYQQALYAREMNRQTTKEQNQMRHWAKVNMDRVERERQQSAQDAAKQKAKLDRLVYFRDREDRAQALKVRTNQVQEQRNAMMRSSIFT